ncbi:hypothetical protein SKAU_G00020520, partial [Synaphobranchus kaupii]
MPTPSHTRGGTTYGPKTSAPVPGPDSSEATGTYPMLECTNLRAGQDDQGPTVLVYRPWKVSELQAVCEDLPDPTQVGGARFKEALRNLVRNCHPTAGELQTVLIKKLKLRWGNVRGTWSTNHPYNADARSEYMKQIDTLETTMKSKFLVRLNWEAVRQVKQKPGETVNDFLERLTEKYDAHSGMDKPDNNETLTPYETQLTHCFLDGLDKHLATAIKTSCVGW